MSKLFYRNALAVLALAFPAEVLADVTGTPTLSANATLNLDTGKAGSSGGDVLWTGTDLKMQGSATGVDLTTFGLGSGSTTYGQLNNSTLGLYTAAYMPGDLGSPAVGDVIGLLTNGGNNAKILVTAISGGSITLQFTAYVVAPAGPTISAVINNYSGTPQGLPSYAISPGALFVIYGKDLSDPVTPKLQSSAAPGLPLTLNHTSISVTVGGKTVTPAIYYTSATQVAAVLPSSTPTGSGTITVTYNGTTSPTAPLLVNDVFGIDTLAQTGSGAIVATDSHFNVILPTASANPGQTITIWGSGLGADTANDDRTYPLKQDNLNNATVYIGGVKAEVKYAGRSQYPGVDQVNVVIPPLAATPAFQPASMHSEASSSTGILAGCAVSVVVVVKKSSNFGTIPINAGGGVCSDAELGINGSDIGKVGHESTYKYGSISLTEYSTPSEPSLASQLRSRAESLTTSYYASANFSSTTGSAYVNSSSIFSIGSCIVSGYGKGGAGTGTSKGLDAGSKITLKGGSLSVDLPELATSGTGVGAYQATLSSAPTAGTAYTFTGTGGKDVGAFSVTVDYPVPLDWTDESSITTVTESAGQLVTWSGGAPGTFVIITGDSANDEVSASFSCWVPIGYGQFTIPSYVLETLPTGMGSLALFNFSQAATFTAPGIDSGTGTAGVFLSTNVTYK